VTLTEFLSLGGAESNREETEHRFSGMLLVAS
jgi:hypothetical protein